MREPLRVLIVEDSEDDALILLRELRRGGYEPNFERVETEEAMGAALEGQPWDLIIADYALPHFSAPAALALVRELRLETPFIVVSGKIGEETAVAMMKAGAHDYIMKENLARFLPAVNRELREAQVRRERKGAEEEIQRLGQYLELVFESAKTWLVILDENGDIVFWNRAAELISGYSREEVLGHHKIWEWLYPNEGYRREITEKTTAVIGEGKVVEDFETMIRTKGGEERVVSWHLSDLLDQNGTVIGSMGLGIDITERRRLEMEILRISEAERRHIGQELHDELGQSLAGIALMSKALAQELASGSPAKAAEANKIVELVNEAADLTRSLARGLCPVEVEAHGLMSALQELASTVRKVHRVSCDFRCEEPVLVGDNATARHLYRIAQEAVTNALKHGRPKHVVIGLSAEDERATLRVEDDGTGFPEEVGNSEGMGLRIMKYRAEMIGASLDVGRAAGGGAVVTCSLPHAPHKGQAPDRPEPATGRDED